MRGKGEKKRGREGMKSNRIRWFDMRMMINIIFLMSCAYFVEKAMKKEGNLVIYSFALRDVRGFVSQSRFSKHEKKK